MEENTKDVLDTGTEYIEIGVGKKDNLPEFVESVDPVESEINLDDAKRSENVSEYDDSGDSYSDEEGGRHVDSRQSGNSGSDTEEGSVILEREEGDGQESIPVKKVDDDEDKKNPQYIPKRGTFYEHDDRTADDGDTEEVEDKDKAEKDSKKKVWSDKKEKWNHDKYNDNDQTPKSRAELIAIYGYDIRNEEGPPRARRRRRYGRGPNKYTRNWEDEDAYNSKPPSVTSSTKKGPHNQRRSSRLNNSQEADNYSEQHSGDGGDEASQSGPQSSDNQNERITLYESKNEPIESPRPREYIPRNNSFTERQNNNNKSQQRVGSGRVVKQTREGREMKDSDYKGFTKPRQYAAKSAREVLPRENDHIPSQNYMNRNKSQGGPSHELEKDMSKMNIQDQGYNNKYNGKHNSRQGSVPPRLQAEHKGSKRYSSLRQRSLPESPNPPPFNHQHYYPNEYNQQVVPQQVPPQQAMLQQHQGQMHTVQTQMTAIPPPPLTSIPQVPVNAAPLPPQFGAAFAQAPPPFLQPAPPTFIQQQTPPTIINYVPAGQPQYAPPPATYQAYPQSFNPVVAVSQPTEIFQPPGGITYYSAHDQQAAQRAAPQKRPKAAIPIVPPPPFEPRGRGRTIIQDMQPMNSDIIIESNLVLVDNCLYEDVPVIIQ